MDLRAADPGKPAIDLPRNVKMPDWPDENILCSDHIDGVGMVRHQSQPRRAASI
jgi:hypothetical protein